MNIAQCSLIGMDVNISAVRTTASDKSMDWTDATVTLEDALYRLQRVQFVAYNIFAALPGTIEGLK